MASIRQNKIARLIQKELGDYFLHNASKLGATMISVTVVRPTPDLGLAKVYLSIMANDIDEVMKKVESDAYHIRKEFASKVRNQLRKVPEFRFYVDDSWDYANKIDQLLKK